jgi:hypothetical protein
MAGNLPAGAGRSRLSRCVSRHRDGIHLEPFACQIARARDDRVSFLKAADHFHAVAIVAANLDLLEMHCVILQDHGGHGPIGANNQGFTRDQQGRILSGAAQVDLGVHSR